MRKRFLIICVTILLLIGTIILSSCNNADNKNENTDNVTKSGAEGNQESKDDTTGTTQPSKIEPTLPSLDDEKDNINLDPPENCESFWTFDYGYDHTALMRVYCDENGKIQLIEKYPLFDNNNSSFLYNFKYNSRITCNDVFGMVSEKYVFSYCDDVLDKMTYYHTSESHLGIREFKKGYVMKFEELESIYPTLKGQIYVNNMPTYSYDIFEFHDDYITRSIYGNTAKVEKITYTSKGRPYSRESNVSPDSHNWYMTYDENGNIKTAGIYSHSNDVVEEYIFDIQNDRLVGISFEKSTNSYQGTYSKYAATLTYNESGLFSKAEIQYPTYEVVCSAEYDELNRIIESRYEEDNSVVYTLSYSYDENGYFKTINYNIKSLTSTQEVNADFSFKYDDNENLIEITYPEFDYSFSSYEMKTHHIAYSLDGKMLNDGIYEYEYYSTGELYRRTEIGGDSYVLYYKNGLKKEEVYHYGNYTFTDYYDEVDFYHAFDERCLYWYLDEHSSIPTGGSPTAKKSIVVQSDGSKCEVERIFGKEYNLLKRIAHEYYPNGNLMRKTISEYNELGCQINGETITYDENGNVIS